MKKIAAAFLLSTVNCQLLTVVTLFTLFTLTFAAPVHAQTPCPDTSTTSDTIDDINRAGIAAKNYDDKYFNLNQIAGTTDSLLNLLTGCSQLHPETNDLTAGTGALAASGRLVATLYAVPPVSGVTYFANQIQKFNPIQPAYAQEGTLGFTALQPVQRIWAAFRNIAYAGFAIIMVIMGFMIMFRAHISPQAVVTVQDSIPRLVVALILVTFSYAIAGLMIDVMFVILNVIINTLESQGLLRVDGGDYVFKKSVVGVIFGSYYDVTKTVASAIFNLIDSLVQLAVIDKIAGFFGAGIAVIIVAIALIFIMFRILFMLLMAYVSIILLTMLAPFFFLLQALPGNNSAKEWFKQIAANVAVFPVVAIMFILAGIIGGISALGATSGSQFTAQKVGQFPLFWGDLNIQDIGKLIALGFIFMTPQAAEMIKNLLGTKGLPVGIPPAIAGAAGAVGKAGGFASNIAGPGAYFRKKQIERDEQARLDYAKRADKETKP